MAASMFEVVGTVKGDGDIPITKCRSTRTGLTVCIAEVEGPLVNGYFCLATEAHDDDGLPHTLEHLVFMGSEDYPYKGVLDLLANRCLASGTNAWTDTDHTCYTMTNAGSQGFLQLLPIYMDHILYPTLTESSYITEVHHINEDGENAGVVYCEMQARENEGESRTHLEMIRAMYPGHCGYRSETGGIMKNLRESTSHKKVCDYHHEFYRPENLCLVITGQIKAEEVFKALQPIEEKILSKGSRGEFSRPWQSQVPPLEGSTEQVVKYAADEESHGIVCVAWRGPPAQDPYQFASADLLLDYLTDSAISPLQKEFVECEEPYCSNVHGYTIENSESTLYFKFDNVVKEKLDMIHPILTGVLKRLSSGGEKLDMTRISNLIHRKILEGLSSLEDNPHNKMAAYLIGDFLFSKTQEHMEQRVKIVELYTKMKAEPESFWLALLNKYFIDKHHTVILGEPSISLMKEMGEEEAGRVTAQQDSLGKDGLEKMASRLQHATEENEKEAPDSLLTSVNIPDVSSIHFHPISPYSNRLAPTQQGDHAHKSGSATHPAFPLDKIPFRFQLDDIHSNFVQMNVLLDSSRIPQNLKYYLPLYCEVLFESQIQRDGVTVSHEDVISQLEADTLATGACLGVNGSRFSCGNYPQLVHIKIQVEREKYEKGVQWLHEILYDTQFTAERLKTVAKKMNNEIAKYKRKGNAVLRALIRGILFTSDCNHQTNSMLKQNKFLDNVLADLDKDPKKVEENMEELRRLLTRQNNITVHVATNVDKLTAGGYQPQTPWKNLVAKHAQTDMDSLPIQQTSKYVLPLAEAKHLSVIVGVGSVESAYLIQTVPCVDSFDHPDLAAINIFIQCLTQLEGPMWRQIRGLGLAYHYSMYTAPETGSMYLLLARATHIVSAFKEARDIVMGYVNGSAEFSEIELETAKSSLTFEIIEKETTVADVTTQSMLAYLRNVPYTYNRDSLKSVSKVTMEDMKRVGKKYIASLFEENQVRRAICCNPSKVTEVVSGFAELGVTLETLPSLDNSSLCELD